VLSQTDDLGEILSHRKYAQSIQIKVKMQSTALMAVVDLSKEIFETGKAVKFSKLEKQFSKLKSSEIFETGKAVMQNGQRC
jgi:hypothetical protein